MDIKELKKNWNEFGKIDPLWAILSFPDKKENKWHIDEFFESGVKEIDAVMHYVESLGIAILRRRALDFGCGVGRLTQALARHFNEACGVDIAPSMIELARNYNRHGNKCTYCLNETDNLMLFVDNSFDFIYSNITLQHMEPRYSKEYIKEFLRILIPQGLLIFQQPSELVVELPALEKVKLKVKMAIGKTIRSAVPTVLLNLFRIEPISECYGIKREELVDFLKKNGARIVDVVQDHCMPGWISFRYCISKD